MTTSPDAGPLYMEWPVTEVRVTSIVRVCLSGSAYDYYSRSQPVRIVARQPIPEAEEATPA